MSPYQRVIMFVDNAGADVVLGMIPFARELLRMGAEVRLGTGSSQQNLRAMSFRLPFASQFAQDLGFAFSTVGRARCQLAACHQ